MAVTLLRTVTQVLNFLNNYADTNVVPNGIARVEGSPLQDFIDTASQEFGNLYVIVTFVQQTQTIPGLQNLIATDASTLAFIAQLATAFNITTAQAQQLITNAVDEKAQDEGLTRNPAINAILTLRFYSTSNNPASIPLSTTAQTQGLNPIQFQTTVAIVAQTPTLDPVTGLYYIDVSAQAVISGSTGNVPVNTVTQVTPPVAGFTAVTNITASSNGQNIETNAALLARIQISLTATQLDTIYGLKALVEEQPNVQSAFAVDDGNPLLTRGTGNLIDIWELGDTPTQTTDTIVYATGMNGKIILAQQPVDLVTSVTVNSVLKIAGVDYNFAKDTSGFANSVRGNDAIVFISGHLPTNGQTVIVQYNRNSLIATLQNLFNPALNPQNQIPNTDILIRSAFNLGINIAFAMVIQSGYSLSSVQAAVTANLEAYFATLGLGQSIDASILTAVIQGTPGVDHLVEPFTTLAIAPETTFSSTIVVPSNSIASINSITFV